MYVEIIFSHVLNLLSGIIRKPAGHLFFQLLWKAGSCEEEAGNTACWKMMILSSKWSDWNCLCIRGQWRFPVRTGKSISRIVRQEKPVCWVGQDCNSLGFFSLCDSIFNRNRNIKNLSSGPYSIHQELYGVFPHVTAFEDFTSPRSFSLSLICPQWNHSWRCAPALKRSPIKN